MYPPIEAYVAQTIGELMDKLGSMMLDAPKFEDTSGYLPGKNLDNTFLGLTESFNALRRKLGEDRYRILNEMTVRMRAHFEADPDDVTADGIAGRELILEMEKILTGKTKLPKSPLD